MSLMGIWIFTQMGLRILSQGKRGQHQTWSTKDGSQSKKETIWPGKSRLLLEEVLVRPAGGAHPAVCGGPNALV